MLKIRHYYNNCRIQTVPNFFYIICLYIFTYGWILWSSDCLPYIMDNNESFSTLVHSYNMYHGDWSKSFGLTDEAFSLSPEAHPIIHTHQGNWPRIFSFILYVLGARDIESQIAITTFTIGLLAIWFAFRYFTIITNSLFSLIVCIILMTDYILFAQWQVCTYRVWHVFFIFSGLLCIHGLTSTRKKLLNFCIVLNYLCLFYGELVFAVYISTWTAIYIFLIYFRKPKIILRSYLYQSFGAILSLVILFIQLCLFMGSKNVIQDFLLTFHSRNFSSAPNMVKNNLKTFYENFNIAFHYNIVDGSQFKNIKNFLGSFFEYGFQVHTPILGLIVLILFVGWMGSRIKDLSILSSLLSVRLNAYQSKFFLFLPFLLLICSIGDGYNIFGILRFHCSYFTFIYIALSPITTLLIAHNLIKFASQYNFEPTKSFSFTRLFYLNVSLIIFSALIYYLPKFYNQNLSKVWFNILSNDFSILFWYFIILFAVFISAMLILIDKNIMIYDKKNTQFYSLLKYLVSGFLAYTIIYILSPGYVHTGYLKRFAPFLVFLIDIMLAIGLYILIRMSIFFFTISLNHFKNAFTFRPLKIKDFCRISLSLFNNYILAALSVLTVLMIILHWLFIQYNYLSLFPSNILNFCKILNSSYFRGKTSISNGYALPFAYQTNTWSFFDNKASFGKVNLDKNTYTLALDLEYLWFADRKKNSSYLTPNMFICFIPPTFENIITKEENNNRKDLCSSVGLFQQCLNQNYQPLKHKLIMRDESGQDRWAIIQLNWQSEHKD